MSNHAPATSRRSVPRWLAWSVLTISAVWLILTGSLWLLTGKSLPLIQVRWASSVTAEQRVQVERELSLILREPAAGRTGTYYVTQSDEQTLKRIVSHRLVEDTAHVSRSRFVLEDAPYGRLWIGDTVPVLKRSDLRYLSVLGFLAGAATLITSRRVAR
jgi:hypothetical protein